MAGAELIRREDTIGPEQSVIGSMLIDPTVVGLVMSELTEEDFLLEANRVLFRGFKSLYLADQVMDPVLVLQRAAPRDEGMRAYVLQLMDVTPTAANIREYIAETRERSQREQLRRIGTALYRVLHQQDGGRGEVLPRDLLPKGEGGHAGHGVRDQGGLYHPGRRIAEFYSICPVRR